ncbi:hypothetical protein GQ457_15G000260 [Hibiscus cannabinus]
MASASGLNKPGYHLPSLFPSLFSPRQSAISFALLPCMHACMYDVCRAVVFKIGLCQLAVTPDKKRNIKHARKAIKEAAQKGAQLVVLPMQGMMHPLQTAMLAEVSGQLKITIVGGSIPERCGDKLYYMLPPLKLVCIIFMNSLELQIHLFDIDIPGKLTFMESKTFTSGETPTIVDTDVGRIGIGICHDICFEELAMIYASRGAHLICYPGAFNMTLDHRIGSCCRDQRAADNQILDSGSTGVNSSEPLYVATCSPARDAGAGYIAWGHSTLVGPFGDVIATTEHDEDIIIAEIDYSILEQRRTRIPLAKQRRGDLYRLVDIRRLDAHCRL